MIWSPLCMIEITKQDFLDAAQQNHMKYSCATFIIAWTWNQKQIVHSVFQSVNIKKCYVYLSHTQVSNWEKKPTDFLCCRMIKAASLTVHVNIMCIHWILIISRNYYTWIYGVQNFTAQRFHFGTLGYYSCCTHLVHSSGVRNRVSVLDDRHRLSCQDGLVNPQGSGEDLDQTDISGNLVANCRILITI
jgi:hypothetical protein